MRRALRWMVWQLTRERTLGGAKPRGRKARVGRGSRGGMAMLLVVSIIALLSVLVTEVVFAASMRIQLAAAQRDEAKAEALAMGGVQFYRLLLIASKQMEGSPFLQMIAEYVPAAGNADTLWQLIPSLDSSLLRLLVAVGGSEKEAKSVQAAGGLTDQQIADTRTVQTSLRKALLDFDGDFVASVKDEERKIYVGRFNGTNIAELMMDPQAGMLAALMTGDEADELLKVQNLDRWELIGNLHDWTDPDNTRVWQGGNEDSLYQALEPPYLPKNAPFDTLDEIRLVDGWERDAIWEAFGQHVTIYGNGRVNVNTASRWVLEAILKRFIIPSPMDVEFLLQRIQEFRNTPPAMGGGYFPNPQSFVSFVEMMAPGTVDPELVQAISVRSTVFRVRSVGDVGNASVTIEAVFDFNQSLQGKVVSWRVF